MGKWGYGVAGNVGLMNLNGNVLVSVDTETSGLVAGHHDILEVAFVPLDAKLEPMKDVIPFHTLIRPKKRFPDSIDPEAMKRNGIRMEEVLLHGVDPWRAADYFEQWVERLCLAPNKKLYPLAHNWPFDREFVRDWLAPKTFESLIHFDYRDTMPNVKYLNDKAEFEGRKCPFPQTSLQDIRAKLGIPVQVAHRALDDAITTAKVYRKLMDLNFDMMETA